MNLPINQILQGDCLHILKKFSDNSINCVVTIPPYWRLRDYGVKEQLGLEASFQEYINNLCNVFNKIKKV